MKVVFVCVENSNRSQMAEAFARMHGGIDAYSAGSRPSGRVNPRAVAAMQELGYDLAAHESKSLAELPDVEFDVAVTMGCGDACPTLRAKRRIDWQIPDPRELPPAEFAQVRDLIGLQVRELLAELGPMPAEARSQVVAPVVVQPPLGISHLLLWILGAAVVLAVMRGFSPAAQERSATQFLHVANQVTFSLLAGTHIAAVLVYARRMVVRDAPLLVQPGHWLLVIAGVGGLATWLMFAAALGLSQLLGVSASATSLPYQFLPVSASYLLMIVLNVVPLGRQALTRSWRLYFVLTAFASAAMALVFGVMFVATLDIAAAGMFFFPAYGFSCIYPLDQLATIGLLTLAFMADRVGNVPRDWVHRVGVVTIILQSVASLAFYWGMMLAAG